MNKLILRWLVNAVAIGVAVSVVPGVRVGSGEGIDVVALLGVALIFGLVNALVRPVLKLLSCALVVLTLGLFIFVINAAMLYLTAYLARSLDIPFEINGFANGLVASVVITVISLALNLLIPDGDDRRRK